MLLFEEIYDAIIHTLAEENSITIQDLHKNIVTSIRISLPNFYKIISKLVSDQILIKEGGKISIHKRWVLWISLLSEKLNQWNNENNVQEIIQLKDGQSLEYFWWNILEIDGLWWNLMLTLNIHYWKTVDTFVYQSHPYYMLGSRDTEIWFFEQEKELTTIHFLTGNTGLLDLYGIQFYKDLNISTCANDFVLFPKEWYCITVIGDYIFEFIYPDHITEYFKLLFETTKLLDFYNPELFKKILETRVRCKLAVRKNRKHAEEIRKKFIIL